VTVRFEDLLWPAERAHEALEALARASALPRRAVEVPPPARDLSSSELERWIGATASWIGLEAELIEAPYGEVLDLVRSSAPALVRLSDRGLLLLIGRGKKRVKLLDPNERVVSVEAEEVRAALSEGLEATISTEVEVVLDRAKLRGARREVARHAILRRRLSHKRIGGVWMLRVAPGASPESHASQARVVSRLLTFIGAHATQYGLVIASWWMLGASALQGRTDRGALIAWGLILLTSIPVRMLALWAGGLLANDVGALVKQRLLVGALRMRPEDMRQEGIGRLLARVIESEALEALALSGGLLAIVAVAEICLATTVLLAGAGASLLVPLLAIAFAITLYLAARYYKARREWTDARLEMTHDMIERMVGHRTRVAQEPPDRWHEGEDQALLRYLDDSRAMDRVLALLLAGPPRAWLVLAVFGLGPVLASSPEIAVESLAVSVGGVFLAGTALRRIAAGLAAIAGAAIAWRRVKPLFDAAGEGPARAVSPLALEDSGESEVLLEATDLSFRYRTRSEPILDGARFTIRTGDRVLLEGASGSGKSTLGALLAGLRSPDSGLLLLKGFDHHTLGVEGWRRRVVAAPQFHENHVISGPFAFNLLMGRSWPASDEDLSYAEKVCKELGLGPLLARMPGGLGQMVGETGWQLSHGERSRLFIARALLQEAELVVLDESFAALDPATLEKSLRCVLDRAKTLVVIAHP
jgi:ATP-binding cassette, subfamily B, bacterial